MAWKIVIEYGNLGLNLNFPQKPNTCATVIGCSKFDIQLSAKVLALDKMGVPTV